MWVSAGTGMTPPYCLSLSRLVDLLGAQTFCPLSWSSPVTLEPRGTSTFWPER